MVNAVEERKKLYDFLKAHGRTDASIIVSNEIPSVLEPELRKIIGPSFDDAAKLMREKDGELLVKFGNVVLLSAKKRTDSPPPFSMWAIDIASRAIENNKTVEQIADADFQRSLSAKNPGQESGPNGFRM